jgi:hypothetical protein
MPKFLLKSSSLNCLFSLKIKEAMFAANREHKDTLGKMEQKFFEEKMRLQLEANQKIAELAEKAHGEAIQ